MEERDEILIGRYLANKLSETEKAEVDLRMKEDPLFRQEFMAYKMAMEALRIRQREELRARFKTRDIKLDANTEKPRGPYTLFITLITVAALVFLTLYLSKLDRSFDRAAAPEFSNGHDSLQQIQPQAVDSMLPAKKEAEINNPEKDKKKAPPQLDMAEAKKKGEELFAEYFEPYKDSAMDPISRGEIDLTPFEKYQKAYWDGEYQKTVELFAELPFGYQQNDNFRFSYANALLKNGKTDQAISILESILSNNQSKYWTESNFTLAMAYLLKTETNKARTLLDLYISSAKARQKEAAINVRKVLNF